MHRNPERLAWIVLLSSFFVFCMLVTLVPLGGQWWLRQASTDQTITPSSAGTMLVTRPGRTTPEVNLTDIPVGSTIATKPDEPATLIFASMEGREVVATLWVYGDTELVITQADTPRYRLGANPNRVELNVTRGRVRVVVGTDLSRKVLIQIYSKPDTLIVLETPGSNASLEATFTQSIVTVREGEAAITAQGQTCRLAKDQRAEVSLNTPPTCQLPAERNLIANGDFQEPLTAGWTEDPPQRANPNDDPGKVEIVALAGQRVIHFSRPGGDWGQVGITQEINRDVSDLKSLRLQFDVLVSQQDLWNCGQQGSECPIMVKVNYVDTGGGERAWLKGFYYKFSADPRLGPLICASCPEPRSEHQRVDPDQWTTYDYDLLDILRQANLPAAKIKSLTIYASGHTFDSKLRDVQLLASE